MTQDIIELEQRIAAAFDRMDQGLELLMRQKSSAPAESSDDKTRQPVDHAAVSAAGGDTPDVSDQGNAALLRALEAAKASLDDWAERYRALQSQKSEESLEMAREIARLTDELGKLRAHQPAPEQQTVLQADSDQDMIATLTARLAAQEAELQQMRAARAQDASELGELLATLAPMVEEVSHV